MAFDQTKYSQNYNKEHYYRPSIYLPMEYKNRLKELAKKRTAGNISQLVTQAIDEYFEKYDGDK